MKTISFVVYAGHNIIYQVMSLWFGLFFASIYLNSFFIPDGLRWHDGKLREDLFGYILMHLLILIVEALLLMFLLYFINRWYLTNIAKANNPEKIAKWTAGIYAVVTLTTILIVTGINSIAYF